MRRTFFMADIWLSAHREAWKPGLVSLTFRETIIHAVKGPELAMNRHSACHVEEFRPDFETLVEIQILEGRV